MTTDFRLVLATVAERHLMLPDKQLAQLFPNGRSVSGNLNFLRS